MHACTSMKTKKKNNNKKERSLFEYTTSEKLCYIYPFAVNFC